VPAEIVSEDNQKSDALNQTRHSIPSAKLVALGSMPETTAEGRETSHTLRLVVPFEDENIYDWPEDLRAAREVPRVDVRVREMSLQDAAHKFCRGKIRLGPACHRQVLIATLQDTLRTAGGKDTERLLRKMGPDIRKFPFTKN